MRVWLASYPRSGNTFLRIVMNAAFGLKTTSLYNDDLYFLKQNPELIDLIGHYERPDAGVCEFEMIKTHNGPQDSDPAIYIIRDGRSAIVSYFHYAREIANEEITLADVIVGSSWPGSWSNHVVSWDPLRRDKTLLIKYEEMLTDLPTVVNKIGMFLNRPSFSLPSIDFEFFRSKNPSFFRKGRNEDAFIEIEDHFDIFEKHHGDTMRLFGYL